MILNPRRSSPQGLLEAVDHAWIGVQNVQQVTGGPGLLPRYLAYLRWVRDTCSALGAVVSPADLERLVLTRRYWALQGADPGRIDATAVLLNLEIEERVRDFALVREELSTAQRRWSAAGDLVVADTNVYVHHKDPFEQVDWHGTVGYDGFGGALRLVAPMIVIDELDQRKRDSKQVVRSRARTTLKAIYRLVGQKPTRHSALQDRVSFEILADAAGHSRLPRPDDELVDRCQALMSFSGKTVHFVTFDTGAALRGGLAGLEVHLLGSEAQDD